MKQRRQISRREFLRVSAVVAAGAVSAACVPVEAPPPTEPAAEPAPAATPAEEAAAEAMPAGKYQEAPMLADLVSQGEFGPLGAHQGERPLYSLV